MVLFHTFVGSCGRDGNWDGGCPESWRPSTAMTAPELNIRPFDAPPAIELDALPEDAVAFYGRHGAPEWRG